MHALRLLLLVVVALPWCAAPAATTITSKGKSDYRIVISANALPSEKYAAEELRTYLQKITGVALPVVTDAEPGGRKEILLGNVRQLTDLKRKVDFAALGEEGFHLRTEGSRLLIAGGGPRGTLYGVYALLEEHLGVRWFTPEVETVPRTNRLILPALDFMFVPRLQSRDVFWTEMMRNADFAARHRLNGQHYGLAQKHGGAYAVFFPFVHSFESLIPKELFKDHPEYFSWINGKRVDGYVQRCLSNPEVVQLAKKNVRQWIDDHPEATIISVSQNDTGNWCQCEACKALDDAEGSPAASLIRFVNAIAEDIEKDHPRILIETLAYQYTRKPPKTLQPRGNVIVRLCSIECCFAHSLAACPSEENRRFRDDIVAWQPVAKRLYIWDYTPNFAHYVMPFPNFNSIQPNVQFFADHNVQGLFEQGNYNGGISADLGSLRAYLLAKLVWDPKTDLARHQREFIAAFYGSAAPKITTYVELVQQQVKDTGVHAHIFDPPTAKYLNAEFTAAADKLLAEAEAMAGTDAVRQRVELARLPVWYVQIATGRVKDQARADLVKRFLDVARASGMTQVSEGLSLKDWAARMGQP
jgi:hypothetical protein